MEKVGRSAVKLVLNLSMSHGHEAFTLKKINYSSNKYIYLFFVVNKQFMYNLLLQKDVTYIDH